jgi:hypothetical protein
MENYITEDDLHPSPKDKNIINTEILLTQHFINTPLSSF